MIETYKKPGFSGDQLSERRSFPVRPRRETQKPCIQRQVLVDALSEAKKASRSEERGGIKLARRRRRRRIQESKA
jgi:hypothetical protein